MWWRNWKCKGTKNTIKVLFQLKGLIQESLVHKFNSVKDSPNYHFIYLWGVLLL